MEPARAHAATWSDFLALPDDDRRELIQGQFMELEVPTLLHEHIVAMVIYSLMAWRKAGGGGHVLSSGYRIRIRDDEAFMPDAQYFRSGRIVPEQALTEGGPDLAVEVISPSSARYDQVEKLNGYASIGTSEYWLIHPENRTLHRYVLGPTKHFVVEDALEGDAVFRPATFKGLEIPLGELWNLPR
jgi:Uma2 family endonuclease